MRRRTDTEFPTALRRNDVFATVDRPLGSTHSAVTTCALLGYTIADLDVTEIGDDLPVADHVR